MIDDGRVVFAGHSERYSGIKNDPELNRQLFRDCFQNGKPHKVAYFERPWLKKARQLRAGQYSEVFRLSNVPVNYLRRHL